MHKKAGMVPSSDSHKRSMMNEQRHDMVTYYKMLPAGGKSIPKLMRNIYDPPPVIGGESCLHTLTVVRFGWVCSEASTVPVNSDLHVYT